MRRSPWSPRPTSSDISMLPTKFGTTTPVSSRASSPMLTASTPISSLIRPRSINAETIKVAVRFRPPFERELTDGGTPAVHVDETGHYIEVQSVNNKYEFTFDHVFTESDSQLVVFEYALKDTVDDVLDGYDGTILAYGQADSGKTYTMLGPNFDDNEHKGMIPRIAEYLFQCINQAASDLFQFKVQVSAMELNKEQIHDLLNKQSATLRVRDGNKYGKHVVYVENLLDVEVASTAEFVEVLHHIRSRRDPSHTESALAHTFVFIEVHQQNLETSTVRKSTLLLVDLASFARINQSGLTLDELKKANLSLTTLSNAVMALADGRKHVPYRDSKLTHLLKESLGGNARTTVIVTASPSVTDVDETLASFGFATRAKLIRNRASINHEHPMVEMTRPFEEASAMSMIDLDGADREVDLVNNQVSQAEHDTALAEIDRLQGELTETEAQVEFLSRNHRESNRLMMLMLANEVKALCDRDPGVEAELDVERLNLDGDSRRVFERIIADLRMTVEAHQQTDIDVMEKMAVAKTEGAEADECEGTESHQHVAEPEAKNAGLTRLEEQHHSHAEQEANVEEHERIKLELARSQEEVLALKKQFADQVLAVESERAKHQQRVHALETQVADLERTAESESKRVCDLDAQLAAQKYDAEQERVLNQKRMRDLIARCARLERVARANSTRTVNPDQERDRASVDAHERARLESELAASQGRVLTLEMHLADVERAVEQDRVEHQELVRNFEAIVAEKTRIEAELVTSLQSMSDLEACAVVMQRQAEKDDAAHKERLKELEEQLAEQARLVTELVERQT
ncbi:hypothetical protein AMAG_09964 [Allomyces macrogynus ATCC 38327]|uniref:Kinesin motor domain-containing protein n=1 Tax=Allomyces macrogynus (strain ATCC 38327) TaxID=578462 RepID=A0A0L0SQ33_ALLM3|nr:hypothetical protein AMAG_09964 [Allomyces macrogynus ATCC 38327]|eukprot:KNE64607.1 hypothetical protein AMAG_09964 [Allomyces macrogynus ATCC 38327]